MNTRHLLRLEGVAVFAAALIAFVATDQPWWLLAVLALAPDLGMLGYGLKAATGFGDTHLSSGSTEASPDTPAGPGVDAPAR